MVIMWWRKQQQHHHHQYHRFVSGCVWCLCYAHTNTQQMYMKIDTLLNFGWLHEERLWIITSKRNGTHTPNEKHSRHFIDRQNSINIESDWLWVCVCVWRSVYVSLLFQWQRCLEHWIIASRILCNFKMSLTKCQFIVTNRLWFIRIERIFCAMNAGTIWPWVNMKKKPTTLQSFSCHANKNSWANIIISS